MVVAAVALGYKNFIKDKNENPDCKHECIVCKYIYNPNVGNKRAGVQPGTAFEDLPEDWVCPVCGEGKDMFEAQE